jgi:hypothetical protein
MANEAMAGHSSDPIMRVVVGFIAGCVAVLTFHQATIWILGSLGIIPGRPFPMAPRPPFGLPTIVHLAFWGGVWGVVIAVAIARIKERSSRLIAATLIDAIGCSLVGWFVVAPLRGVPGPQLATMWRGLLINGVFGFGTGFFIDWVAGLLKPRTG